MRRFKPWSLILFGTAVALYCLYEGRHIMAVAFAILAYLIYLAARSF